MKIRAFITQHKAEKISECQDRLSVNNETKVIAVSDGVSQSIFPDYWAELLVNHYTTNGQLSDKDRINLCSEWNKQVLEFISNEKQKGNNPWRTESNLMEGISAGATLCGVKFTDEKHWICEVIGDSCLIKVGKNNTIEILSSEEKAFDTYPDFLDSNPLKKGRGSFKLFEGELSIDDKIIIVSDPFSDFFYKYKTENSLYIGKLLEVSNHDEYVSLVEDWRKKGMHNDDSTVIIVEWDGFSDFELFSIDNLESLIENETKIISNQFNTTDLESQEYGPEENMDEKESKLIDIQVLKVGLKDQIPEFVQAYIEEKIRYENCLTTKFLMKYILKNKERRMTELEALLNDMLNEYIETIK